MQSHTVMQSHIVTNAGCRTDRGPLHPDAAQPARAGPRRGRVLAHAGAATPSRSAGTSPSPRPACARPSSTPTPTRWPSACRTTCTRRRCSSPPRPARRSWSPSRWLARWRRPRGSRGVFGGYLEDLCYTPKTLKAVAAVEQSVVGDVTWVRSRETHPGPHSAWLWDGRLTGRRRRHHRPRLPLHQDHPHLRRQGQPPGRGHVHHRHLRPPHRQRGQRGRADPL